jgi:hypothetical protein
LPVEEGRHGDFAAPQVLGDLLEGEAALGFGFEQGC